MGYRRISAQQWARFEQSRKRGLSIRLAADRAGISESSAKARERELRLTAAFEGDTNELFKKLYLDHGLSVASAAAKAGIARSKARQLAGGWLDDQQNFQRHREQRGDIGPIPLEKLNAQAKAALADIDLFARRYFGLVLMPWQIEATQRITDLQATDREEFAVINVAPGTGKSTFFTLVLPAWLTCRDRTIRGLIGSASQTMAKNYVANLRDILTTQIPLRAKPTDVRLGTAFDAEATLVEDYGAFKPDSDQQWSAEAFQVRQHGNAPTRDKERTWQAFGRTAVFIGSRVDFCIWDDAYDPTQTRTAEARVELKRWWDNIAESRVEPGGLLILQGQRLDADDLYRHALDKIEGEDEDTEQDGARKKYHHIIFQAHYDDRCKGEHKPTSPPYPAGCLLYPRRLTWRKLSSIQRNDPSTFEVVYQQRDIAAGDVLVNPLWVSGGVDPDSREHFVGCWDADRDAEQIPANLRGRKVSVVTVDPSPTRYWALQWWCYAPDAEQVILLDNEKVRMGANDLLDWRAEQGAFHGYMPDWQDRSIRLGLPITHWVIEINAAQRFLLAYDHVDRWRRHHPGVHIVAHQTTGRKLDPDMGVTVCKEWWRSGRVRLPGRGQGRFKAQKLVDEVTRWPNAATDDQVMAQWFLFANLPSLRPASPEPTLLRRPSWAGSISDPRPLLRAI